MYTISKGHSKIVAKTRRGLTQKLESLETIRDLTRKGFDPGCDSGMSSPKPVFHSVNGKRSTNQRVQQDSITPQHEEIIKYIYDSWNKVYKEYEMNKQGENSHRGIPTVTYYQDKDPNPALKDFQPFDLESWWGKRIYQNLTQNT